MIVLDLLFNVLALFILMVPGVIMKKCKLAPDGMGKGISNLVLYIAQPVLILLAYLDCTVTLADIWQNVLAVFLLSVLAHALFVAVAIPAFSKAPDGQARMLRFATAFSNAAFMGIPLIQSLFPTRPEMAIYASIYNVTFNLFLWTVGVILCTKRPVSDLTGDGRIDFADTAEAGRSDASFLKVILHPTTLASVLGIICLAVGLTSSDLRDIGLGIIPECLSKLAALVAPLAMLVLGLRLAEVNMRGFFKDKFMYLSLLLRHLALPLALLGIIKLLILIGVPIGDDITLVVMILAATPSASSATMFAEKYDCDAVYVSRLVVASTVLAIATMPLIIALV